MKRLALPIALGMLIALAVGVFISEAEPDGTVRTIASGQHFLPPYPNPRDRFGFDSETSDPLTNYDVAALNAGWYSNWGASLNPAHPDRLTYVQLIRFKAGADKYDPAQVTVSPSKDTIARIAAAHPGSLWMMSNEPDSTYQGNPILPEVYAHVYHEFYHYIKGLDPTALIANGGIVQPTPCRIEYLDIVWDTYYQAYSETLPVDVWNIHAFILREVYGEWGASTPPGVDPSCAMDYAIRDGDDIEIFRENLIAFRQWMKDKGDQDKPLIISEYGILWPSWLNDEDGHGWSAARVSHYMTQTFDLFLYEAFPDLGCPEDGYRLAQAWAWYSLSDTYYDSGKLFNPTTGALTGVGQAYSAYTAALPDSQYTDAAVQLWLNSEPLDHISPATPYEGLTVTLPVEGVIANLGKAPADVPLVAPLLGYQDTQSLPARYEGDASTLPLPSLVLTQSGLYSLSLIADPAQQIADPRRWNNAFTVTVDARPDLVISTTAWSAYADGTLSGTLKITLTVANTGKWPSSPVSGTLTVSNAQGTLSLPGQRFPLPTLGPDAQETITEELTLDASSGGLYYVTLEVDSNGTVDEQDENNNWADMRIDARPDLVISATGWSARLPITTTGLLSVTLEVTNVGLWPTLPVSTAVTLKDAHGTLLLSDYFLPTPALAPGAQVTNVVAFTLLPPAGDLYHVTAQVDSDGIQPEQNEENNLVETITHIVVTTTLQPDAASVLTSTSGHLMFIFPAGTVTVPTEIRFTPLATSEVPPGPLRKVTAFQLAAYRDGQPVSLTPPLPITVTWQYKDADIAGLDENELGLYRWIGNSPWQHMSSPAEQRWPDENRLCTAIQQLGEYTFGQMYRQHLPVVMLSSGGATSAYSEAPVIREVEQPTGDVLLGRPLRLPPWAIPPAPH
jgi:hypothetical protein